MSSWLPRTRLDLQAEMKLIEEALLRVRDRSSKSTIETWPSICARPAPSRAAEGSRGRAHGRPCIFLQGGLLRVREASQPAI